MLISPLPEGSSSSSSSPKKPPRPLEASKWLDFLILVSEEELASLLELLGPIFCYRSRGLFPAGEALISKEAILSEWKKYLTALEKGEEANVDLSPFYLYLTKEEDAVFRQLVEGGRERLYPVLPCLISQPGRITYSDVDETFRMSAFGPDTLSWGLKITFPQSYLDPETREICRGDRSPPSPNAPLLDIVRRWVRDATLPVAFRVGEKRSQTTFRLGKKLQLKHPSLEKRGIFVA